MVNARQEKEIEKHMRKIKKAKDEGNIELARSRTQRLHAYLQEEGIIMPEDI